MDKLCDSDADSADTDPEMPPYGQALISERGLVCSQHPGLTQVLASTTTSMNTATAPTLCR